MTKKIILIASSALLLLLAYVAAYFIMIDKDPTAQASIETLTIKTTEPLKVTGRQEPMQTSTLKFDDSKGIIHDWFINNHTKVKAGDKLYEYYNPSVEQQIVARQRKLSKLNHFPSSKEKLNDTKDTILSLQHEIDELQDQLRTPVTAPIDGKVLISNEHPSKPKENVLAIYSDKRVIRASLDETQLPLINKHSSLIVKDNNLNKFTSKVTDISYIPTNYNKQNSTSTYDIQLTTDNKYPIGTHFKIEIPTNLIKIPRTALYNDHSVLVKRKNRFIERKIKYNKTDEKNKIIVTEGLNINEKIAKNTKDVS
ncbi:efflux RND transporter periplasmic adaptor subunit [Staphylococcus sp. SQ8-PEA]|uniref:Efflux RND transporter periplasmic adaptor subunit n=1 Tax=Staphylococcus marylandisciuri TaxID=2981529 RepID=A0ABT2QSI3_9STAP|nr:efflux RND transporter periplasmic adaptor subunit [Staphylococcus marylandisciuri]MCU5746892.1 efflux RND transporter periplasmic adaptor subunit [Staphylococcus marylandisciuri]